MNQKLMRTWYATDVTDDDPDYRGAFSAPFPARTRDGWTVVAVDWSQRGWVEVTWLIPAP